MKGKATTGRQRMHLLSNLMKKNQKLHESKARSSRQRRLERWNVINLLVAAED